MHKVSALSPQSKRLELPDPRCCLCGEDGPDSPIAGPLEGPFPFRRAELCLEGCRRGSSKCVFTH